MAGKSYITETRELAYRTWRECGQNIELTIKTMKERQNIPITKPTIYAWKEKFNWEERAARAETEEQRVKDVILSDESKILADLEKQRQKYERYFDSMGDTAIDPQATYAYNSLAKTITDIKARSMGTSVAVDKPALFMESMEFIAGYLKGKDPEGLKVLAHNFDGIIEAFKEKHAQTA
jgi:hypothetical protein